MASPAAKFVVGISVLAVTWSLMMGIAAAGASWFEASADNLSPGESVTMVGFTSGGDLGWLNDGPFFGFVNPESPQGGTVAWNGSVASLIPVGELTLDEIDSETVRAHITFAVPDDLSDGTYAFEYCNDPCTTGIGDLVGGTLYVGGSGKTFDHSDPLYAAVMTVPALAATGDRIEQLAWLAVLLLVVGAASVVLEHQSRTPTSDLSRPK